MMCRKRRKTIIMRLLPLIMRVFCAALPDRARALSPKALILSEPSPSSTATHVASASTTPQPGMYILVVNEPMSMASFII